MSSENSSVSQVQSEALLQVKDLKKHFVLRGGLFSSPVAKVHAVDGVSFEVKAGETLGVVGESGCGKSTLGRCILRLHESTSGSVVFDGKDLFELSRGDMKDMRQELQVIFQDPFASLNPRQSVGEIIEEPLKVHGVGDVASRKKSVEELLTAVGLRPDVRDRYPHEFSGGQRQRISIARALALKPKMIICDEPVSALDVSVQAQIINLMMDLQRDFDLTYVFIAHDLAVVKHISDAIMVMYLGQAVEKASTAELFKNPVHPYTRALLSAIPRPNPESKVERQVLEGDVPSPINPPPGCHFHTRCPYAEDKCKKEEPPVVNLAESSSEEHLVNCHFAEKFYSEAKEKR